MKLKPKKTSESEVIQPPSLGTPDDAEPEARADTRNVTVTYGIHKGQYPIGGMRIGEARQVLGRLISIDPTAVAVINGHPVDEDQQITEGVTTLSFVKPSAMKGAGSATSEIITIEDQQVHLTNGTTGTHAMPVESFVEGLSELTISGMTDEPIPDNVKWLVRCGSLTVCIVQLTPQLRWMQWLSNDSPKPFGPEAVYDERCLATPFVILKIPFRGRRMLPRIELFYRNTKLASLDGEGGELFWPNLYNISVNAYHCTAWYCSQYLRETRIPIGIEGGCDAVVHDLLGGKFNASSEFHEGLSTFGLCAKEKIDPRVTDVARWEAESKQDPEFVLKVNWKSTGLSVKNLIERELAHNRVTPVAKSAQALGNIILRQAKPK